MPSTFESVDFEWHGKTYTIPANRMMEAIARVEDHLTLTQLQRAQEGGGIPLAKLALAFAAVLRFAGVREITADEVYEGMFGGDEIAASIATSIAVLLAMMIPPQRLAELSEPGEVRPSKPKSSRRRIKSRS